MPAAESRRSYSGSTGTKLSGRREGAEHHVTIPDHKPLKACTPSSILKDVADHLEIERNALIRELFG